MCDRCGAAFASIKHLKGRFIYIFRYDFKYFFANYYYYSTMLCLNVWGFLTLKVTNYKMRNGKTPLWNTLLFNKCHWNFIFKLSLFRYILMRFILVWSLFSVQIVGNLLVPEGTITNSIYFILLYLYSRYLLCYILKLYLAQLHIFLWHANNY